MVPLHFKHGIIHCDTGRARLAGPDETRAKPSESQLALSELKRRPREAPARLSPIQQDAADSNDRRCRVRAVDMPYTVSCRAYLVKCGPRRAWPMVITVAARTTNFCPSVLVALYIVHCCTCTEQLMCAARGQTAISVPRNRCRIMGMGIAPCIIVLGERCQRELQ